MDESLQKSGSWVASFGGVFSPGAEIFRIEHSQQCEVVCQKCCQTGKTDSLGSFSGHRDHGIRSNEFGELKRARVERKVGFKRGFIWGFLGVA